MDYQSGSQDPTLSLDERLKILYPHVDQGGEQFILSYFSIITFFFIIINIYLLFFLLSTLLYILLLES